MFIIKKFNGLEKISEKPELIIMDIGKMDNMNIPILL